MRFALLALLAAMPIFAAGTCTTALTKITAPSPQVPNLDGFIARMTCTADAADGSFPNTNLPRSSSDIADISGLYFYQAISNPGSPAPTDNWDYTLIADTGLDYMGGNGANRDTTTTELEVPATLSPILNGDASLRITGNSVNSAVIVIDFYLVRTGALRASSGGGGSITLITGSSGITVTNGSGPTADVSLTAAAAPVDATYITQTANSTLTNEQAIGALSTGLMKVTTTTGAVTSVVPGTGVETWITTPTTANLATALGATPVYGGNNCGTATYLPYVTSAGVVTCSITAVYNPTAHQLSVGDRLSNPSAQITIGELTGFSGIWFGSAAPAFGTYSMLSDGNYTYVNAATGSPIELRVNNVAVEVINSTLHTSTVPFSPPAYRTATNCADSAGAAACGSAAAGAFVIDASGTSTVVSTTAVTANSRIFVFFDSSLSAALGITCNTTVPPAYGVSARTAATSFTLTATASVTNPACFSYFLVN